MRHLAQAIVLFGSVLLATAAVAQEGTVIIERTVTIPRDATFGNETLGRGSYRIALTDVGGEMWFVIKKGDKEVGRDVAIELPSKEVPTEGIQGVVLKGEEYYRIAARRGDKVYLIHFLLKGGKA
jgi:hypothetical protein